MTKVPYNGRSQAPESQKRELVDAAQSFQPGEKVLLSGEVLAEVVRPEGMSLIIRLMSGKEIKVSPIAVQRKEASA